MNASFWDVVGELYDLGKVMAKTAERRDGRLSQRVRVECPLRFRMVPVMESGFRQAFAQDISQSGFRFHSREYLPKRAGLIVEINPPGHAPIRSLARAVWVREKPFDEGYEVGGMFIEPPHSARTTLARLVSGR